MSRISRVTRSKTQARSNYDHLSRFYDVLAGRSEARFRRLALRELAAQSGEVVLEIGFGTGHALVSLARSVGESGQVHGVDISAGMHRMALARISKAGLAGRVTLHQQDAVKLPFEAGMFDAILMCFTLELFDTPEIPLVLHECQRVLRRGGRLATVTIANSKTRNPILQIYEWAHRKFPILVDCRPIYAEEALQESSFRILRVTKMAMWGIPVEIILCGSSSNQGPSQPI